MKHTIIYFSLIAFSILVFAGCNQNKENAPQKEETAQQVQTPKSQKTIDNLKAAILGETTASAKYAAFAKKAADEGYAKVSKMFEAISHAEGIHAGNHKRELETLVKETVDIKADTFVVGTTAENLADAIKGETYESTTMYPDFIAQAKLDNEQGAVTSFDYALQTEKKHKQMYENALKLLQDKKEKTLASMYYVCPKCGYTYLPNELKENCIVCYTSKEQYIAFK
ncbi:MAG TPA: rubrerythrin [Bacteroidetes bacterium]|nr:rubrerythrin [Bacteroidota bacterium]